MKKCCQVTLVCLLLGFGAVASRAQSPRMSEPPKAERNPPAAVTATPEVAPETVNVKYEGGYLSYTAKMDGSIWFDHMNERLVFRNKDQKEMFSVLYQDILSAYGDTQSHRPAAATVVGSAVPYGLGLPALLIKKKYRYLNVQFRDREYASGIVSFKFEDAQTLATALQAVASESGLTPQGEGYVRKRKPAPTADPGGTADQ